MVWYQLKSSTFRRITKNGIINKYLIFYDISKQSKECIISNYSMYTIKYSLSTLFQSHLLNREERLI